MDGIVHIQPDGVKCETCVHCENGCASEPNSSVRDCQDYEQKLSDIFKDVKVVTNAKGKICQTCLFKGRSCVPNHGNDCSEYQEREQKLIFSHNDPLCQECLIAENCALKWPTDISEDGKTKLCSYFTPKNEKPKDDKVNHPSHYTQGGIECIRCIEASMKPEGFQDYCKGNVIKYIYRWRDKGGVEDLKKASVYLNWLIESAENGKILYD